MPAIPLVAMSDISKSSPSAFTPVPLDGVVVPSDDIVPPDQFLQRQPEYRMEMVEKMGGSVGVESDGQNGSSFWIELPAAD